MKTILRTFTLAFLASATLHAAGPGKTQQFTAPDEVPIKPGEAHFVMAVVIYRVLRKFAREPGRPTLQRS